MPDDCSPEVNQLCFRDQRRRRGAYALDQRGSRNDLSALCRAVAAIDDSAGDHLWSLSPERSTDDADVCWSFRQAGAKARHAGRAGQLRRWRTDVCRCRRGLYPDGGQGANGDRCRAVCWSFRRSPGDVGAFAYAPELLRSVRAAACAFAAVSVHPG